MAWLDRDPSGNFHVCFQGWSFVRIAAELGLHRETVPRYVHERQSAGFEPPKPTQVHTGSLVAEVTRSASEPHRHTILSMLEHGLSAVRIHQDLLSDHDFRGSYYSVMRFVRHLEVARELSHQTFLRWNGVRNNEFPEQL